MCVKIYLCVCLVCMYCMCVGEYMCIRRASYFNLRLQSQHRAMAMMTIDESAGRRKHEECHFNYPD